MTILGIPLAFLWTALLVELTPGPNMSYLAVLSLARGKRAGFAAVAGVATGLLIVGLIAALGLAAVISQSPLLYNLLRWGGVAYLVWLAVDIWQGDESGSSNKESAPVNRAQFFRRGLATNLLNPKAAVFYIAALPPFVDPAGDVLRQTISLSLAYVAVATVIHLGVVSAAASARGQLQHHLNMAALRRVLAVCVLIVAVWLAWSTRSAPGG